MLALEKGPLRTMRLAGRLPQYAPRTIYRQTAKLARAGLVERSEEDGIPATVRYRLTPAGRGLCRLLRSHTRVIAGEGQAPAMDWATCTDLYLLAEAWEMGWIEELSSRGGTATEMAGVTAGFTFHQVARRLQLLRSHGLLGESRMRGRGHRYQLTDRARRDVGSLLALARWGRRRLPGESAANATVPEVVAGLKALVPLVRVPASPDRCVELGIAGNLGEEGTKGTRTLIAAIDADGLACIDGGDHEGDGWAIGTANTWLAAILDGSRGRMRVGGDLLLVDSFLRQLEECQRDETISQRP